MNGEDVEVGPDPGGEAVVNLPSERRVAVERRVAEQQPDPLGQQRADAFVAAKDVDLVDALHFSQGFQDMTHQRRSVQRAEVLACDALAVEPDGNECYGFHGV